jgi:hypothetical protein
MDAMNDYSLRIGQIVTAMTYADPDRDFPAQRVTGELACYWVETLQYWQYSVDGVGVDPSTIQPVEER